MADVDPLRTSVADDLGSLAGVVVPVPAPPVVVALEAGTVIGEHFVIEEPIGSGGMGVVYRAHDRQLDRKVALKLDVRGRDLDRARREAVALARLAHPNVVTIHEIGEHDGHTFVAMELCPGGTVRSWMRAVRPRWRQVLDLFVAAGRGLAAAHAAGLVHRDVKPDNILLGADGRARIGDFGLARDSAGLDGSVAAAAAADGDQEVTARSGSAGGGGGSGRGVDAVTATGAIVGTPRYMAPEQRRGEALDARADQFAFALSLYEALAGVDPFPAGADERARAIDAGVIAPPPRERAVPRRVLAVLARGLAAEPARRWPSMDALLAALERAVRRRWPWVAAGGAAVIVLGGVAFAVATRTPAAARAPDPCAGLEAGLAPEWSSASRAGFVAAHGKAASTAAWTADVIDHHAAAWGRARTAICVEATHDATWSADLLERGVDCLRQTRRTLLALAGTPDTTAAQLMAATSALSGPELCARPEQIAQARSETLAPEAAAARSEVLQLADDAEQATAAGDLTRARALAEQAVTRAKAAPAMARARAEQALGGVELASRGIDAAAEHFRAAYFDFRSVSDGIHTFSAAFQLAQAYAGAGKPDLADEWLVHARVEAERTGASPSRVALLENVAALSARARGDHAAALAAIDRAIGALEGTGDPVMVPSTISAYATKATLLADAGRLDDSIAAARTALEQQERLLGPDHPDLLTSLANIGLGYADQGKTEQALPWLARGRELADRVLPRDSIQRAIVLLGYGENLAKLRPAEAVPVLREVVRIVEAASGADSDDARQVRASLQAAETAAAAAATR